MKSVRLSRRGALFIPATLLVIGCERSPTSDAGISGPRFSVVASITTLDLGTLGGNTSVAAALNAAGHVAGGSTTATGEEHAFFWDGTTMRDLGTLGGNSSEAFALNDAGQVAGESRPAPGACTVAGLCVHAFFWDGTTMRDLGTLGGSLSTPSFLLNAGLNAAGQVTGHSFTASNDQHAFFWDGTTMRDLGTLGGKNSIGEALNAAGQVAGRSTTASSDQHAFLWEGTMHDLGTLGGKVSGAAALNAAGQVAGGSTTASGDQHAFFWDGTTMRDLGTLGGNASFAIDLNKVGQVAGYSTTASGDRHATRWTVTLRPATPTEEIQIIRTAVNNLVTGGNLGQGQAMGLLAKLDAATRQLNSGKVQAARNILQALIQQVQAFISEGILSAADGQPLIDAAQSAINQLSV